MRMQGSTSVPTAPLAGTYAQRRLPQIIGISNRAIGFQQLRKWNPNTDSWRPDISCWRADWTGISNGQTDSRTAARHGGHTARHRHLSCWQTTWHQQLASWPTEIELLFQISPALNYWYESRTPARILSVIVIGLVQSVQHRLSHVSGTQLLRLLA